MGIDLYEAMSTLRTVRRLRPEPVPDEVLHRVLTAATWAPTGGNRQPWRVIVVRRRELKERLGAIYRHEWERFSSNIARVERLAAMEPGARATYERSLVAATHLAEHLADVPVLLVFCADPRQMAVTDIAEPRPSFVAGGSIFTAVQNLLLACRAEGLGCALTTLHCFQETAVRELLDVPDGWGTAAMVPVGYPELRGHGPISRMAVEQLCFSDTFGQPWPAAATSTS